MPSDAPHDKASFLDKAMSIIDDLAMDRAQLPLNALRAFEAAARHLHFSRAAPALPLSQRPATHQVAKPQRRPAPRTLHRTPRRLPLTPDGPHPVPRLTPASPPRPR